MNKILICALKFTRKWLGPQIVFANHLMQDPTGLH